MTVLSPITSLLAALTAQLPPPPTASAPARGFLELLAEVAVADEEPTLATPDAKDADGSDLPAAAWAGLLPAVFAEPPPPPVTLDAPPADEQLEAPAGPEVVAVESAATRLQAPAQVGPFHNLPPMAAPQESPERPAGATPPRAMEARLPRAIAVSETPAPVPPREAAAVEIAAGAEEPRVTVAPAVPVELPVEWAPPDIPVSARPVPKETAAAAASEQEDAKAPARPVRMDIAAPAAGERGDGKAPASPVRMEVAAPVASEQGDGMVPAAKPVPREAAAPVAVEPDHAKVPARPVPPETAAAFRAEKADLEPVARAEPAAPPLERPTPEHRPPATRPESAAPADYPALPPDARPASERRTAPLPDAPPAPAVREPARVQLAFAARLRPAPPAPEPGSGIGVDHPAEATEEPGKRETPTPRTARAAAPEAVAERPPQQRDTTWIQPARDTEATPSPERQSAAEPKPAAARSAAPRRESPLPAPVARDIRLEIGSPDRKVEVRLVERAGDVHLAVRTPDGRLADGLREQLPQLSARLEQSGFRADEWRAAEAGAPERRVHVDAPAGGSGDARQHGHPQDGRQERREGEPRDGEPETPRNKEKGNAFAWLMESLR